MTENEAGSTVVVPRPYHTRLEASGNRDIVYCHACSAEWWRDENGIVPCPSCGSDVTQVVCANLMLHQRYAAKVGKVILTMKQVNLNDDVRPPVAPAHPPRNSPPPYPGRQSRDDSDPEEADISQYMAGSYPGSSSGTDRSRNEYRRRPQSPNFQERDPQNDHEQEAHRTVGGFSNLLAGLLGPAFTQHGQAVNEARQRHERQYEETQQAVNQNQPRNPLAFGLFGPPPRPGQGGPRPVVTTRVVFSTGNNPPLNFVSVNGQPIQDGMGPEADIAMYVHILLSPIDLQARTPNNIPFPNRSTSVGDAGLRGGAGEEPVTAEAEAAPRVLEGREGETVGETTAAIRLPPDGDGETEGVELAEPAETASELAAALPARRRRLVPFMRIGGYTMALVHLPPSLRSPRPSPPAPVGSGEGAPDLAGAVVPAAGTPPASGEGAGDPAALNPRRMAHTAFAISRRPQPQTSGVPAPRARRVLVVIIRSPADEASRLFGQMMGMLDPNHTANSPANGNEPHAANPLGAILASILNPGAAVAGDAVYSQEALDRIITQLMEQQSSTAPGPARQPDIDSLPLKKADAKMLFAEDEEAANFSAAKGEEGKESTINLGDDGKPKASCPVCMEDVYIGDTVCELGCKHWFHEECVKSWLGSHNTCPICRKPVGDHAPETAAQARDRHGAQDGGNEGNNSGRTSGGGGGFGIFGRPRSTSPTQARRGPMPERLNDRLSSIRETGGITYARRDPVTGEMGAFQPATGGFANPDSDAFADFLAGRPQPSQPQSSGSGRGLRRSDSFPLSSPHRENPLAQNPYVDNVRVPSQLSGTTSSSTGGDSYCEGRGQSSGVDFNRNRRNYATAFPGASDDGRSDRSRGSRHSDRRSSGGGIWGMASGLWRRFSGQDDQGEGERRENERR